MAKATEPISLERACECYHEGIALFNERRYFEAHEVWEEVWLRSTDQQHHFFQGLIQCAISLEHMQRGNAQGARRLFRRCQTHFSRLPRVYMGLDVWSLIEATARALSPGIDPPDATGKPPSPHPRIALHE